MTSKPNIRNEELLLLRLCRLNFIDIQVVEIKSLAFGIMDWNYFAKLANSHGVAALVYHNLEKLKLLELIPDDSVSFLRGALLKSLGRNAFHTETMGEVLKLLNANNIKTVLLKGMALEISEYGNEGLRQMSDVDILLDKDECVTARNIMLQNGFVSLPVKSFFHNLIIADIGKHLPSLLKNGASVEIHHELFGQKDNSLTKLFYEESYESELKGEKVYIPGPQLFFLYLIRHLNLHEMNNESQLRLYTDLLVLIENHYDEIINDKLFNYASLAGMSEVVAQHLGPLREMWNVTFPVWINEIIDKWYDQVVIDKFIFFLKSPKDNPPINKPGFYRNTVGEIPGIHRKFLYILGDIFPSISFMKKRYRCSGTLKSFILLSAPDR